MNNINNKINSSNIKDNNGSNSPKKINFNNINYKNKNISSILEYIIDKNKEITFNSNESLGQGGFGLVFSMKYKNKSDLALKIFLLNDEINLMRNILHFNIIRSFYKIKDNGKFMGVLMEECKFKSLSMFMNKMFREFDLETNNKKFFYLSNISEMMIKFFIIQILNGLKFFYIHNIIHGDIKMENILLSNYFVVKITDFSTVLIINKKNEVKNNNNISNKINVITNSNKSTAINSNVTKNSVKLKSSTYSCMGSEYYYENPLILDYNDLFKVDIFGMATIMYKTMYKKSFIPNTEKENYKIENFKKWKNEANINLENDRIYSKPLRKIVKNLTDDIQERADLHDLLKNDYLFPKDEKENYEIEKTLNINRYDPTKLFVELNKLQHIVNIKNIKSKFLDKKFVHKKKFSVKL